MRAISSSIRGANAAKRRNSCSARSRLSIGVTASSPASAVCTPSFEPIASDRKPVKGNMAMRRSASRMNRSSEAVGGRQCSAVDRTRLSKPTLRRRGLRRAPGGGVVGQSVAEAVVAAEGASTRTRFMDAASLLHHQPARGDDMPVVERKQQAVVLAAPVIDQQLAAGR